MMLTNSLNTPSAHNPSPKGADTPETPEVSLEAWREWTENLILNAKLDQDSHFDLIRSWTRLSHFL